MCNSESWWVQKQRMFPIFLSPAGNCLKINRSHPNTFAKFKRYSVMLHALEHQVISKQIWVWKLGTIQAQPRKMWWVHGLCTHHFSKTKKETRPLPAVFLLRSVAHMSFVPNIFLFHRKSNLFLPQSRSSSWCARWGISSRMFRSGSATTPFSWSGSYSLCSTCIPAIQMGLSKSTGYVRTEFRAYAWLMCPGAKQVLWLCFGYTLHILNFFCHILRGKRNLWNTSMWTSQQTIQSFLLLVSIMPALMMWLHGELISVLTRSFSCFFLGWWGVRSQMSLSVAAPKRQGSPRFTILQKCSAKALNGVGSKPMKSYHMTGITIH